MVGDLVQFECFDMREWLRVSKAWNGIQDGARTCTDDHVGSAELMPCPVGQCGLHSPGTDEASGAEDEFRSALFVIVEIQFVQGRYHPAFAVAHERHSDCEAFFSYAEVFTSANVRRNLRTVNNVLAGQTGNVGARSANVFAIDHCDTLSLRSKCPCSDSRSGAAAEDHKIEFFRFAALGRLSRRGLGLT